MKHTIIKNAIPLDVCDYVKDFFYSRTDLYAEKGRKGHIRIHNPWEYVKDVMEPYILKYIKPLNDCGGNIYKHDHDYGPHTDSYRPDQLINCLIPIYLHEPTEEKQHIVIFDQYISNGVGRIWRCKPWKGETELEFNKKTELSPYQDELVHNKIEGIDMEFYKKYLEHAGTWPDMYRGLTGTAYEAVPGNLILFNSNHIHTTGKLNCSWKIGLFQQFLGGLDELLINEKNLK